MFRYSFNRYYTIDSKIHNINALIKIISLILFLISLSIANNTLIIISMLIYLIFIIYLSKIPANNYLNIVKSLISLIVFMFIISLIFSEPIIMTISLVLKLIIGVVATNVITFTTTTSEMVFALNSIIKPLKIFKINSNKMAMMITLALQFIPNIFIQLDKIIKSQASRGVDFKYEKISGKIKAISSIVVPLLYLTIKRSDDLADAMTVRSYDYNAARTSYKTYKISIKDYGYLFINIIIILLAIIGRVLL